MNSKQVKIADTIRSIHQERYMKIVKLCARFATFDEDQQAEIILAFAGADGPPRNNVEEVMFVLAVCNLANDLVAAGKAEVGR